MQQMTTLEELRSSKWCVLVVSGLAVFTDMVIYAVVMPILKEILDPMNEKSATSKSIVSASYAVGLFIFTPVFGILSDRYHNRKIPMLIGQAGLAISTLLFAFSSSFAALLLARSLQGIAGAATWVVGMAMLSDVFAGPRLGFYMSIVFTCHTAGFMLGPLIGGFLHDHYGLRAPFYICAGLSIVDFLGRMWIKEPKQKNLKKGISIVKLFRCPEVILACTAIMMKSASYSSVETLLEQHLFDSFGYTPSTVSLIFMSFILPGILSSVFFGYLCGVVQRHLVIAISLAVHPFASLLIGSESSIVCIVLGGLLFGTSAAGIGTPVSPELSDIVDSYGGASYAQVFAILNIFYSLGLLYGPVLTAGITERYGFGNGLICLNYSMVIFSPIFYFLMQKLYPKRIARAQLLKHGLLCDDEKAGV